MLPQLDLARAINEGRAHSARDHQVQRSVELARQTDRAHRRTLRRQRRRS